MKIKNIITTVLLGAMLLSLSVWCIFGEKAEFSESERRALAKFPELSVDSVISGDFAKKFEEYSTDVFPERDLWRRIKAYARLGLFMQSDNNKIFLNDGHLSKLEYPANYKMADHAIGLFTKINDKYLNDTNKVYFSMIPDKNKYLADLSIDYSGFEKYMTDGLAFAETITIGDLLEADDSQSIACKPDENSAVGWRTLLEAGISADEPLMSPIYTKLNEKLMMF